MGTRFLHSFSLLINSTSHRCCKQLDYVYIYLFDGFLLRDVMYVLYPAPLYPFVVVVEVKDFLLAHSVENLPEVVELDDYFHSIVDAL